MEGPPRPMESSQNPAHDSLSMHVVSITGPPGSQIMEKPGWVGSWHCVLQLRCTSMVALKPEPWPTLSDWDHYLSVGAVGLAHTVEETDQGNPGFLWIKTEIFLIFF